MRLTIVTVFSLVAFVTCGYPADPHYEADFQYLWQEVADQYAFFDLKQTDWHAVKTLYAAEIKKIRNDRDFVMFLERILDELYDPHAHLNTNTPESPPLLPSGTDLWAEWRGGRGVIVQVRPNSSAAAAGIVSGFEVTTVGRMPVQTAMQQRIGKSIRRIDDTVRSWALTAVLAGQREKSRQIGGILNGKNVTLQVAAVKNNPQNALLAYRWINETEKIGHIRFHNSLGNSNLISNFDRALSDLRHSKGLILDLRDTPGGGNTTVARAIISRFISREAPYQKHSIPGEEKQFGVKRSWLELVSPRGDFTYTAPVVLLVDHWTGSMGEGIAIGMDAVNRGKTVGTRMAGLLGATYHIKLPNTAIGFNLPAEKLFHVDGRPREDFVPSIAVDLTYKNNEEDFILKTGLQALRELMKKNAD